MPKHPIAVQMYTLRNEVASDYAGTLRAVAELGYGAVELTTLGSFSAAELRTELDTLGLQVAGMHVGLDRLERQLDTVLDELRTLGARYVVCPAVPPERRSSAEGWRELARSLDQIGRRCRSQGLQLCYHNHDFEFQRFDNQTGLDILFGASDPELVKSELDVYWAAFAGADPVALIRQLGSRVPLIHLKDMAADPSRTFAEVGHGVLDFAAIFAAGDEAGVEWYIVEQDRCARPPLESIGMSLAYLRSIGRA
jgi:sugar phosphate isomerase/epimerase